MLGSARVSRAGERVLAIADFSSESAFLTSSQSRESETRRFGTSRLHQLRVEIDLRAC